MSLLVRTNNLYRLFVGIKMGRQLANSFRTPFSCDGRLGARFSDPSHKYFSIFTHTFSDIQRPCSDSSIEDKHDKSDTIRNSVLIEYYNELLVDPRLRSEDEWASFGSKFEKSSLRSRWPTIMLTFVMNNTELIPGMYELGMSLLRYAANVQPQNKTFLLLATVAISIHQGGPSKYSVAYSAYEKLSAAIECFDITSINILVTALSKTDMWKECSRLIDMVKVSGNNTSCDFSPVLVAAIQHDDMQYLDDKMGVMSEDGAIPGSEVYHAMLDHGFCMKLMEVLRKFNWVPNKSVADRISNYYDSKGNWKTAEATIDNKGKCSNCGVILQRLPKLTADEFSELRDSFMELSVKRNGNVFLHTTPEELEAFGNFLARFGSKPFDVVIDGLNISHVTRQSATKQERDDVLFKVISYFIDRDQRVLVVGREHMRTWKSASCKGVSWFYTSNISADDPFILYAAMHSGLNTYILSNDEMSDAGYLLGKKLRERFKLWQRHRQIKFRGVWPKSKQEIKAQFVFPGVHDTVIQSTDTSVHVPIAKPDKQARQRWYCVTKFTADEEVYENKRRMESSSKRSIFGGNDTA